MATGFALGTYLLPSTIERVGRRKVLIGGATTLTITMVIFVAMIGLENPTTATQWVAVAAIVVYNFVFGYSWIGVPWLYGPEVCSLRSSRDCVVADNSRLHHSSIDISAAQLVRLANGSSPSSPFSLAVLHSTTLAGRFGSGCCFPARLRSRSYISCAQRHVSFTQTT